MPIKGLKEENRGAGENWLERRREAAKLKKRKQSERGIKERKPRERKEKERKALVVFLFILYFEI